MMAEQQIYGGFIYTRQGPNEPWRKGAPVAQGQQMPTDPTFPYKGPKIEAETRNEVTDAKVNEATLPAQIREANAKAEQAELEAERLRKALEGGGLTPADRAELTGRISRLNQLTRQIKRVEELYRAGPGMTSGLSSILDYFGTNANARFDVSGAQLSQQGLAAFRTPGTGTVSDRDAIMFDRGNLPTAATRDVANEEIIAGLKSRVEEEYDSLNMPAPQWGATPAAQQNDQNGPGNALDMIRTNGGGGGPGAKPGGADPFSQQFETISNPALARAHDDMVRTLIADGGGRLDPQAYAAGFAKLAQDFGQDDPNAAGRAEWATAMNRYLDAGGRTVPTNLQTQQLMSATDIMGNNLINNPVGGFLIGGANGLSAGLTEAIAPEKMMALRDANPWSTTIGEIGGAIGSTAAIGGAGRAVAGRFAPRLLGETAATASYGARDFAQAMRLGRAQNLGQVGRNVATDATYGGIYGQNTQGDPLSGAAIGTLGSLAGQGVAKGLGATVGGAQRTAAAEALRARGVPISVGRQLGMGRAEDTAMSLPLVGGAIRNRQIDSFRGFNQAAFDEAGKPIGFSMAGPVGRDAVETLDDAVGDAYKSALGGRSVPLDRQFGNDLTGAAPARLQLPDEVAVRADKLIENHIGPLQQAGQLTGEMYQRARRGLGNARNNANQIAGEFDQPYRETMTGVLDAYDNLLMRGGGNDVIEGLNAANAANKNLRILEDASLDRAKVGTVAGDVNIFTPAQLLQAARKSETKYGESPELRQFAEQGQEVLPSTIPDSGTAGRLMLPSLLTGVGAAGGGLGFASDPTAKGAASGSTTALGTTASVLALAALLGTRGGQRAVENVLFTRPQAAQKLGQGIRRRGGLFGSTGGSMALQSQ